MKTKLSYAREILPASTTRREEEPVHEDTRTVIIRIIRQQSVPFILLLTGTVTVTPQGGGFPGHILDYFKPICLYTYVQIS